MAIMKIYVNGVEHEYSKDEISYEQVVKLAYPNREPSPYYSMVAEHRTVRGRIVTAGQVVRLVDGMAFQAVITGSS